MTSFGRPRAWVLALLLFVLHFVLHVGFSYGRGAPDFLTLAILLLARELPVGRAGAVGLLFGLCEDALSVLAFGANSIALTVVAIGGAITRDLFVGDSRMFLISYVLIGKLVRDLSHWIAVGEGLRQPFMEQVLIQGGLSAVYLAAVGLVVAEVWGVGRDVV